MNPVASFPWQLVLGVVSIVVTILGSTLVLVWRASGWVATLEAADRDLARATAELKDEVAKVDETVSGFGTRIGEIRHAVDTQAKDSGRLEGRIEQLADASVRTTSSLERTIGNLDAVWRTLERLHPNQVTKRLSDRATS